VGVVDWLGLADVGSCIIDAGRGYFLSFFVIFIVSINKNLNFNNFNLGQDPKPTFYTIQAFLTKIQNFFLLTFRSLDSEEHPETGEPEVKKAKCSE
jgi:hypothetical protein